MMTLIQQLKASLSLLEVSAALQATAPIHNQRTCNVEANRLKQLRKNKGYHTPVQCSLCSRGLELIGGYIFGVINFSATVSALLTQCLLVSSAYACNMTINSHSHTEASTAAVQQFNINNT